MKVLLVEIPDEEFEQLGNYEYLTVRRARLLANDIVARVREGQPIKDVTPTRNKRKWIVNKERDTICCPYCHDKQKIGKDEVELLKTAFTGFRFCKYCGAEMEEE